MNYTQAQAVQTYGTITLPRDNAPSERLPRPDMIVMALDDLYHVIRDLESLSGTLLGEPSQQVPPVAAKQAAAPLSVVLDTAPESIQEACKRITSVVCILRERLL